MGKIFQPISEQINQYITDCSLKISPAQAKLLKLTNEQIPEHSHIATTGLQQQFIALMVKLINAKKAIEIGVFTGCGSLAIAEALPSDGRLISCEISPEYPKIGQKIWEEAGVFSKIDLRIAPALEVLKSLSHEAETFDFIFIDADKQNYPGYYEACLKLLRKGGLMILDNMLFIGSDRVMDRRREATRVIDELNYFIRQDPRVEATMVPIEQGMWLVRKRVSDMTTQKN